jgi:ribosomal protein L24E
MAKLKLIPHRIEKLEVTDCEFCGCPLYTGDVAVYTDGYEHVYCCRKCAEADNK